MKNVTPEEFAAGTGLEDGEFVEIVHPSGAIERKHYYTRRDTPDVQLPITDIAVSETRFRVGSTITFDFTSELPDDSYFIPYRVDGDGRKYLKDAVVANGAGSIVFTFDRGGIYYINRADLPLTDLRINGSTAERFTIYVAE
jgi:hypothetical protein